MCLTILSKQSRLTQVGVGHGLEQVSAAPDDHWYVVPLQAEAYFGAQLCIQLLDRRLDHFLGDDLPVCVTLLLEPRLNLDVPIVSNLWNTSRYVDSILRVPHTANILHKPPE